MMRSGGGDLQRAPGMRLAEDVGQVDGGGQRRDRSWLTLAGTGKGRVVIPVSLEITQLTNPPNGCRSGDSRLGHVGEGHVEAPDTQAVEVRDDREGSSDRPNGAVQRQLAKPGGVARQSALLAGIDD